MKEKILSCFIVCGLILFAGIAHAETGIALKGEYVPVKPEAVTPHNTTEGGEAVIVENNETISVIGERLSKKLENLSSAEKVRVIIFLADQPQEKIAEQIESQYAQEKAQIFSESKAIMEKYARRRNTESSGTDAENYSKESMNVSNEDWSTLHAIGEKNEALSLKIQTDLSAALLSTTSSYQKSVKEGIEALGGDVEFGTIGSNIIVALVPAGEVKNISALEKVDKIVADKLMDGHLTTADNATRVSDTDSLWANGYDGGIYDPAIIDSGTDLTHPALKDKTGTRTNFATLYLVAAANSPLFADGPPYITDDRNGHGTHVSGIVGSYGTPIYPAHLGMSYGVDKVVSLKSGWHGTDNRGHMYWSDAMYIIDRALNASTWWSTFSDDVDGMNLSYGGSTTSDETAFSRFLDSVISSNADIVFTISAGNSGPSNTIFNDPACNYNAISVAAVSDRGTASRSDDTIASYSSRGPTASGRRKPDIAAPGSSISSANNEWETQLDYISYSGTSMAAPMVLGISMDLMDAGVFDEKSIKALLINTAQKNEPGINFEGDADGWSKAYGWGYMNAKAAYYHRNDVIAGSVTENGTTGDYKLYKGKMRDEGSSGEGRDRVTMVWNRHATYKAHAYPTSYYNLSDLNLRLYKESSNSLTDYDFGTDNAHQVRIGAGAPITDVVVKVYAWSTNFPHGGSTESYSLATEEGFTSVPLPASFGGIGSWPSEMEPNEVRDFKFWLRNNSLVASHNNKLVPLLPAGWTLVSGPNPYNAGSIAAGGTSGVATWRLKAQSTPQNSVQFRAQHSHNSYGEAWGNFNWGMGVNVRWDTTPPSPNLMTFATLPYELNTSQIKMVARTATDIHGPVEYYFDLTSGASGGNDSTWQTSTIYTDSGLDANQEYCYRTRARDNAATRNYTSYSAISCEYTDIETPTGITFGTTTNSSIQARSTNTPSGLTRGNSGLIVENTTAVTNSGWKMNNLYWSSASLLPNKKYSFKAKARNADSSVTPYSPIVSRYTYANVPASSAFSNVTSSSIQANWAANGNPSGTEYFCENITKGTNSGWTTATFWKESGLNCNTIYSYRVRARNTEQVVTSWVSMGSKLTLACQAIMTAELKVNKTAFTTNDLLDISVLVNNNTANNIIIDADLSVVLPDTSVLSLTSFNSVTLAGGLTNATFPIYSYTFNGGEPLGTYTLKFVVKRTSDQVVLSTSSVNFSFAP